MLTVEELDTYMSFIFTSKELEKVSYTNTSLTDKKVYIEQSKAYMNRLRLRGRKENSNQNDVFPRIINNELVAVNEGIKKALCCIVYDLLHNSSNQRLELIKQGVKSISTGGVSESYADVVEEVSDRYKFYIEKYLFFGIL